MSDQPHYLGIEIGGTKLQIGLGPDDGRLRALWRDEVDQSRGADGIRRQVLDAIPLVFARANLPRASLGAVGIGFGGPVDDVSRTIITSHHIKGWDGFPLGDWITDLVGAPAVLGNDADVAGLGEALHGAGKGLSPIFYVTVGTGIGGGLIIDGDIYRGAGRGAAEIGHLRISHPTRRNNPPLLDLEEYSSGEGIAAQGRLGARIGGDVDGILKHSPTGHITAKAIGAAAAEGDRVARLLIEEALLALAEGLSHVIALLCPRRIVIGGGVSLMGEELFFAPLRRYVAERTLESFAGLTDIVPAALGEEVVVHGAIALAHRGRVGP